MSIGMNTLSGGKINLVPEDVNTNVDVVIPADLDKRLPTAMASVLLSATPTINYGLNIASVIEVSTGIFDVSFTQQMDRKDYVLLLCTEDRGTGNSYIYEGNTSVYRSVNGFRFINFNTPTNVPISEGTISILVFGGKN